MLSQPATPLRGCEIAVLAVGTTPDVMHAVAAAREAGALIVEAEFLDGEQGPWDGVLPGQPGGCGLWPGSTARHMRLRSDRGGLFLTSTIDVVLRSHGVRHLAIAGDAPASFRETLDKFARQRSYTVNQIDDVSLVAQAAPALPALNTLAERIAPGVAALVLIDVQNDFCAPGGATARTGQPMTMIDAAVKRIKTLLAAAREAGLFIVHVRAEYGEPYRHVGSPYRFPISGGREPAVWTASAADLGGGARFASDSVEVCLPGSWGGEFVAGLVPQPNEAVITKHRFGAFSDTGLESMLTARGIRSVILAGVTTNCCVETTAREAVMRDFYLVVASDCVAVKDHLRDLHDATLENLSLYFGLVRPADELIAAWPGAVSDAPVEQTAMAPLTQRAG